MSAGVMAHRNADMTAKFAVRAQYERGRASESQSLRGKPYIGGERERNMTVEAENFAHTSQSLRENRNISVYARARPRQVLRGFVANINY